MPCHDCWCAVRASLQMGPLGIAQIVVFIGFLELFVMKQKEGSFPGDMSLVNPFEKQWDAFDEETKLRKRAIELNNGRAAQMGIFAMIIQVGMVPKIFDWIENAPINENLPKEKPAEDNSDDAAAADDQLANSVFDF